MGGRLQSPVRFPLNHSPIRYTRALRGKPVPHPPAGGMDQNSACEANQLAWARACAKMATGMDEEEKEKKRRKGVGGRRSKKKKK